MNRTIRAAILGSIAGAIASTVLVLGLDHPGSSIAIGILVGAAYSASIQKTSHAYVDNLMAAGSLGIPLWGLVSVVAVPLLYGQRPEWSAQQMRGQFPALVAWVLFGALLGLLTQAFSDLAERIFGTQAEGATQSLAPKTRIVILGGGFAGMKTAECLEQQLRTNASASITLVSETNALLFTPMLALGSVSNYLGMANVEKLAFNFKSLLDAIRIRNHVIEMFERADREADPELRQRLLTFVIAGGGFAGVELAGALNDFARGILADYPNLKPDELNIVLVHSRDRILPELSESLAKYAQQKMEARGVKFKLNARLSDARPGVVVLNDGEIPAETLVWTAGTSPNPLLRSLPIEKDKRGAVKVDSALAVPSHAGVWALGDCAGVTDAKTSKPCPPTAQFAIREAAAVARSIANKLRGRTPRHFHFDSLGALCVVGHQTACAELSVPFFRSKSVRFSGLLAWLMWRGIYLSKLPGIERKIRVLMDWTIELFFPRDIVQTIDLQ